MSVFWNNGAHEELHPEPRSKKGGRRFNFRASSEAEAALELFKSGGSTYEATIDRALLLMTELAVPMCAPAMVWLDEDREEMPKVGEQGIVAGMVGFPVQNWNTVSADILAQGGSIKRSVMYPPSGCTVHPVTGRIVLYTECYTVEMPAECKELCFALWVVTNTG